MSDAFVPASWLYDVETRSTIAHPPKASDIEVREAIEQADEREIRADGGHVLLAANPVAIIREHRTY